MKEVKSVRPSPIAGQWYPANASRLAESVDGYIQAAELPPLQGQVIAVMAPHAGHLYSGPVAGYAFAALRGMEPDLVAVISPMHYPYPEPILTTAHSAYKTPLGEIPVDQNALNTLEEALVERTGIHLTRVSNDPEHSLEIELPFLQRAIPKAFHLLPLMVRENHPKFVQALGESLAAALKDRRAILVASSDLSHFYPQKVADQLDAELLRRMEAFDPAGVLSAEEEGVGFACGRGALAAVLWAAGALGANEVKILHHATSGDVTGDTGQVVGYGAGVVLKSKV